MPVWWERLRDLLSMRAHSHESLPDLRDLGSERVRVEGTQYLAHDLQREPSGDRLYVLRREPRNTRNPSAIAVYAQGRGIGYLTSSRAEAIAPLLDRLGGSAIVTGLGATENSSRLWLNLPTVDVLHAYVQSSRPA